MTDLDIQLACAPFDAPHRFMPSMTKRISNVGVELEMLGQCQCEREVDCECGSPCCSGSYTTEDDGVQGLDSLLYVMDHAGLIEERDMCCYHCTCRSCKYDRDPANSYFLAVQEDPTVGVEFVSRILNTRLNEHHMDELDKVVAAVREFYTYGEWEPDGHESAGNHIHVSWHGNDNGGPEFRPRTRRQAAALINAAYAAFEWHRVADGGCGRIRSYNSKPGPNTQSKIGDGEADDCGFHGSWTTQKSQTFEHRLWNTPVLPERIYDHVGISLALTRWAFATIFQSPMHRWWIIDSTPQQMVDHIRDNRDAFINDVCLYLPDDDRFSNTTTALNGLV